MFVFIIINTLIISSFSQSLDKERESRAVTGHNCEYIRLCNITENSGCVDGTKFVVKPANNNTVRQFLKLNGQAVLAFLTRATKITSCFGFLEITPLVGCKTVSGAADIELPADSSAFRKVSGWSGTIEMPVINMKINPTIRVSIGRVLTGNDCEYVQLCDVINNMGCDDGSKLQIKPANNTRRQFLILNSKIVAAFLEDGKKFTQCSAYTEVTSEADCKVIQGAADIDLNGPNPFRHAGNLNTDDAEEEFESFDIPVINHALVQPLPGGVGALLEYN